MYKKDSEYTRFILKELGEYGMRGVSEGHMYLVSRIFGKKDDETKKFLDYFVSQGLVKVKGYDTYLLGYYGKYSLELIASTEVWRYVEDKMEESVDYSWADLLGWAADYIERKVPELAISYQLGGRLDHEDGSLYYRKDEQGNNIPVFEHGNVMDIMISDEEKYKILTRFPECKNNLYVIYQGKEFKISNV